MYKYCNSIVEIYLLGRFDIYADIYDGDEDKHLNFTAGYWKERLLQHT